MNLRPLHTASLVAGLFLPVLVTILCAVGRLLASMGDPSGAQVIDRLALAIGIIWGISLIGLILLNALRWELITPPDAEEFSEPPEAS